MSKYVSQYSDIPKAPHYAIFTTRSVYIPGDERSRTNPGHGYWASTEHFVGYEAYEDRAEWEARVVYLKERNEPFSAAHVSPAQIKATVHIDVDLAKAE